MTDNQGNSFLLDKLMTTKYPLGVILIELAWQCARQRISLRADWVPRLQNEEADDLTNGRFEKFSPELRVPVDLSSLEFGVLPKLLQEGEDYFEELEAKRAEARRAREEGRTSGSAGRGGGRRRATLRERDPW